MKNSVKIGLPELEYLIRNFHELKKIRSIEVKFDDKTALDIRDWASDKLDTHGFDENYELNEDGKILESLIDIFYR